MSEQINSPFFVIEEFFSPSLCEQVIQELGISEPSHDIDGKPIKHERIITPEQHQQFLDAVQHQLLLHGADIQTRYRGIIKGMDKPVFQQYFENPKNPCELHGCENSKYVRKKWLKVKDVDLVCYVWLKDFGAGVPLDPRFETYGGKLEFPGYNFSLVPQRGTCVIFPAGPHFITAISPVLVGSLEQVKFSLKLTDASGGLWLYDPKNFQGDYTVWF